MTSQDDGQPGTAAQGKAADSDDRTPAAPVPPSIPADLPIPPPLAAPAYAPAPGAGTADPWVTPTPGDPAAPAGPPGAGYPPSPDGWMPQGPATLSGKAIASLVTSLIYACGIGSIVGIVLGHLAWRDINRSHGRLNGKPIAAIGMVLGYVGLATTLVVGVPLALTVLNDDNDAATSGAGPNPQQPGPTTNPSDPTPNDAGTPCPSANFLKPVTPPNTTFNLGYLQRNAETGVLMCIYGQPTEPNGGLTIMVELQDAEATIGVEQYFEQRELTPPTATQLGDASGKAEQFGIDEYTFQGTDDLYRDTAAARSNRAAYLSVPQEFNIPVTTQFDVTVQLLDDIGIGSGSGSTGPGGTSPTV